MSKMLGLLLVEHNIINQKDLEEAILLQNKTGKKLGRILIEKGLIDEETLFKHLGNQLGVIFRTCINENPEEKDFSVLPFDYCKKKIIAPKEIDSQNIKVYISEPADANLSNELAFLTGKNIRLEFATESAIIDYLSRYSTNKVNKAGKRSGENISPVVLHLDGIIEKALDKGASDIHFEVYKDKCILKYRLDGVLTKIEELDYVGYPALISRIKILSQLDISEKRLPQDGKFLFNFKNRSVDIRVSIIPVIYGENAVLRLLDREKSILTLEQLGMSSADVEVIKKEARRPYGMILFTGPTGSGKTTSLYAILEYIRQFGSKIITIEDPVEYQIDGISQVQAHPEIGLDFARGLRSFLRHDPDVIMVGEIRDKETAEVAIRSALTGHLVLSTMHTNNTASAVARFLEMGIAPYLISSSLNLVVAQRLVRRICADCKVEERIKKERLSGLADRKFSVGDIVYKGKGCKKCYNTGYKGRVALFEVLSVSRAIREAIINMADAGEIERLALKEGLRTLSKSAVNLVKEGVTSLEEIERMIDAGEDYGI